MTVLTGDNDLIIGAYTGYNWNQLKFWCNSINMSGFTGKKVILALNGASTGAEPRPEDISTFDELKKRGFNVFVLPLSEHIPIHVNRFLWIWRVLDSYLDTGINGPIPEYVITTDVRDVVFQSNPSVWLRIHPEWQKRDRLVVASESLKYKDEPWGNQNFYQCFGSDFHQKYCSETIYNVGSFAGTFNVVKDLALMIFQMSINRAIPIVDQAVFNFLLYQEPYKSLAQFDAIDSGWAATLGTTMDPTKINTFRLNLLDKEPEVDEDGVVYNGAGIRTCILHQYDRVPGLKEKVEAKYGQA